MGHTSSRYRVEFSSGAWHQVGRIDRGAFDHLSAALRAIAEAAPHFLNSARARHIEGRELVAGPLTAKYEIDHQTDTVLVLEVTRSANEGDSGAAGGASAA